jgi:2-(1,2-epoxy-1,2-dihydrophenyl)acetyl-CoA isomerase
MTTEDCLVVTVDGPVATLRLNRPTVGNSLDVPLARALMEAAIRCDEDPAIRVVVLTGTGRFFCAGGDVGAFGAAGNAAPALVKEITGYLHSAIARLARMAKPLITVVNGPAAGAGFSLAILGDIAISARSAHYTLAYTAIGLTPDGGSTWMLPRLVGLRQAQDLALTNRRVSADEAVTMGLITRAVDDADLMTTAMTLANEMGRAATQALGQTRRLLLSSFGATLESQMEDESRSVADAMRSAHGQAGVRAFIEKRKPEFN